MFALVRAFRFAIVLLFVLLAACTANTAPGTYLVETSGPYTLDTGDVVRVLVYGDEDLTDSYQVDDAGNLAFPLIGPTQVRGLTTQIAATRIAAALTNGFMRNPNVSVEISQYRPFYIQGEIASAGQFAYAPGMTVRAAISTAGGFQETADRTRVTIYRPSGNEMIKGTVALDFPIQPGDTIVVLDRWI